MHNKGTYYTKYSVIAKYRALNHMTDELTRLSISMGYHIRRRLSGVTAWHTDVWEALFNKVYGEHNMDNEIQIFDNAKLNAHIRIVQIDGEPWFVAKDVCAILGTQTRDIRKVLDTEEVRVLPSVDTIHTGSNGGSDRVSDRSNGGSAPLIISESGLYVLTLKSRKPVAKPFRNWVTREVLPAIRKTGSYSKPEVRALPPVPTIKEALQGWLDEVNAHEQTKLERDEAIRTKAWISNKKTASAMGTAGALSREYNKLAREHAELTEKYEKLAREQEDIRRVHNISPAVLDIFSGINTAIERAERTKRSH